MRYSIIIAITLIVAAKSIYNDTCWTSDDCEVDEWCYNSYECLPKCNIVGGVNCTEEIGAYYRCNENSGECVEKACNATADPTDYCTGIVSTWFGERVLGECVNYGYYGYDCVEAYCNSTLPCPAHYVCDETPRYGHVCKARCDIVGGKNCTAEFGWNYECNNITGECYELTDCIAHPEICPHESLIYGVELICNETSANCEPFNCSNTSDCSLNGTVCRSVPDFHVAYDVCYSGCIRDWECHEQYGSIANESWYCDGGVCMNGTRSCRRDWDCDTGYVCNGGSYREKYCVLNCTLAPSICDGNEYCDYQGYCDTIYCVNDTICSDYLGWEYVCNGIANECIEICDSNEYCMEIYNNNMTSCNHWTGQCEFRCYNDSDCDPLAALSWTDYGCFMEQSNVSNKTYGECREIPFCVGNPWYCPYYSWYDGVEWQCDTETGSCVTEACDGDSDCDNGECISHGVYEYVIPMHDSSSDYCYVPCKNDTQCINRFEYFINGGASYCVDGFCVNVTNATTTEKVVEDIDTTEEEYGDGVQGYGAMVVFGMIIVIVSCVN